MVKDRADDKVAVCNVCKKRTWARYVHSDWRRLSSPTEMINQLKWQTLQHRRHTARLTMMYKIQHNLVDIPLNRYTQPARTHCATEHLAAGRRGHPQQLRIQRSRIQAYKHSFFISTIEPWNKLTVQTINAPSIEAFKQCLERDSSAAALYYIP